MIVDTAEKPSPGLIVNGDEMSIIEKGGYARARQVARERQRAEQIPLLASIDDQHTFDTSQNVVPFVMRLRFNDPNLESRYVAHVFSKSLWPNVASFVMLSLLTGIYLTTSGKIAYFFAPPDGLGKNSGAIVIIQIAMHIGCLVTLIFGQITKRFNSPQAVEIWWLLCSIDWLIGITAGSTGRKVYVDCPLNANSTRGLPIPGQCNWIIDAEFMTIMSGLLIGAPRSILVLPTLAATGVLYFAWRWIFWVVAVYPQDVFAVLNLLIGGAVLHGNEINSRTRFVQSQLLMIKLTRTADARDEVNGMLSAMLSSSVLERLMRNEPIADSRDATVLFSDVAGFTTWSSTRPPFDVVRMLNTMYRFFDMRLVPYGVEKITTIGDAYWAAANIPTPMDCHADRVCTFALYMQSQIREMHRIAAQFAEIRIRIGVHSGEVSGGIAGSQQIAYQIFGETTEDAELLEQLAPVGGVLISQETVSRMSDHDKHLTAGPVIQREGREPLATFVLQEYKWLPPDFEKLVGELDPNISDSVSALSAAQTRRTGRTGRTTRRTTQTTQRDRDQNNARRALFLRQQQRADSVLGDDDMTNLDTLKARLSERRFKHVLYHFKDAAIEAAFDTFAKDRVFKTSTRRVHIGLAVYIFALLCCIIAERNVKQSPALYVIYAIALITTTLVAVFALRLPAYVSYVHFTAMAVLLYVAVLVSRASIATVNAKYILFTFMTLSCGQWSPGLNYILTTAINFVVFVLPVVFIGPDSLLAIAASGIVGACGVWTIGFMNYEVMVRKQFIDDNVAKAADEEVAKEQENTNMLLSRTIPAFVLPELITWMRGDRATIIAHAYPVVGTMFCRVPHIPHELHTLDPVEAMARVAEIVNVYDEEIALRPHCVKIKTIGDIMLVATGLQVVLESQAAASAAATPYEQESLASARLQDAFVQLAQAAVAIAARVPQTHGHQCAIGLHAGPLAGGVLGDERLIYDVFGDTVNTTSRIMSTGGEGIRASPMFVAGLGESGAALFAFGETLSLKLKGRGEFSATVLLGANGRSQ